jgi:hypothetical protein
VKTKRSPQYLGLLLSLLALSSIFCEIPSPNGSDSSTEGEPTAVTQAGLTETVPGPTETLPGPTETPPGPTETATPTKPSVSATATFISATSFADDDGETAGCQSGQLVFDPEVDISLVTYIISGVPLDEASIEVRTSAPLVNNYSAATALFIQGQDGLSDAWLWEIHDGAFRIGPMDPDTFELAGGLEGGLAITYDEATGITRFVIPWASLPDSPTHLSVSTFHTAQEGEETICDQAGPFELPQ